MVFRAAIPAPPMAQNAPSPSEDAAPNARMMREERDARSDMDTFGAATEGELSDEIVVTGTRTNEANQDAPQSVTAAIDIKPWSPDRPYLDAVKDQCGDAFEESYFAQRP